MPIIKRTDFPFWLKAFQNYADQADIKMPTPNKYRLTFTVDVDSGAGEIFQLVKKTDDERKLQAADRDKKESEEASKKEQMALQKADEATKKADAAKAALKDAEEAAQRAQETAKKATDTSSAAYFAYMNSVSLATFTGRIHIGVALRKTIVDNVHEIKKGVHIGVNGNTLNESIQEMIGDSTNTYYLMFEDGPFKEWVVEIKRRGGDLADTKYDAYWHSPEKRYRYRSQTDAEHFVHLIQAGKTEDEANALVRAKSAEKAASAKKRKLSGSSLQSDDN